MQNNERKILLLVEGKTTEVKLFGMILDCYPEIQVKKQNIFVYNTNIWTLHHALKKEFGDTWYEEKIDFLGFLKSLPVIQGQITRLQTNQQQTDDFKDLIFTDIFLVFDYERQDPSFDPSLIKNMLAFWSESTENGLLYLNYPMIESYKHLKNPLPDLDYINRKCSCSILFSNETKKNMYKSIVGCESSFTDLRKYTRDIFKEFVIHNLCKASAMVNGTTDISIQTAQQYWQSMRLDQILNIQNQCAQSPTVGYVYVLATCLFFIPEYHSKLIFGT